MNELKKIAAAVYGFSAGCLTVAALSFFEAAELSFTAFAISAASFILAGMIEAVVCPIYARSLRKMHGGDQNSPAVTITGFVHEEGEK